MTELKAINSHFSDIPQKAPGKEAVWYDGKDRPDLDHEGTQYHQIKNSTGFVPALLGKNDIYNMQEVAVDMALHQVEWTGDLKFAKRVFKDIEGILDWETRILDPDKDGLYQNFLNTWISDGHSYNGGGCAQASAYNYAANRLMAKLADLLGYPAKVFNDRAKKIQKALQAKLWLADKGCLAEFIDTIGHKLVHPSPELSTIYLAIDCGVVDDFQAYQMLRFTETQLRNETTSCRNGRLVYSSNWYPKKYSTCGLFPAENIHLALAYFQTGHKEKGLQILNAITEGYFAGKYPGLVSHVLTATGVGDVGDLDFSDVSSMYLRLIVEGLFGIRFHLLDKRVDITPHFPDDWMHADIQLKDMSMHYARQGMQEDIAVYCDTPCTKRIQLPLRSGRIESVLLNGSPIEYKTQAAVNQCCLIVETSAVGRVALQIIHGKEPLPSLRYPAKTLTGNAIAVETSQGAIVDYLDPSGAFEKCCVQNNILYADAKAQSGEHTLFVRVKAEQFEAWMAADVQTQAGAVTVPAPAFDKRAAGRFEPLDISSVFNCSLRELHTLEYRTPRPKGYSIGVRLNGRYAWEWNHAGHNAVHIDDTALRQANGVFVTPSGLRFSVPKEGKDIACASMWDNFPAAIQIPLKGKAHEAALFFIGVTNAMQSWVENARFVVMYRDGSGQTTSLVHPKNFDDWLVPALQAENEIVYFSDYNHGLVQRLMLDPEKELAGLSVEAIANEVIIGLLGVSLRRA